MSGGISTRIIGSWILRSSSNKIKKSRKPSFSREPPEVRQFEPDHAPGGSGHHGRGTSPRREPPASEPTLRLQERQPSGTPRGSRQHGGSSGSTSNVSGSMGPPPPPNTYKERPRSRGLPHAGPPASGSDHKRSRQGSRQAEDRDGRQYVARSVDPSNRTGNRTRTPSHTPGQYSERPVYRSMGIHEQEVWITNPHQWRTTAERVPHCPDPSRMFRTPVEDIRPVSGTQQCCILMVAVPSCRWRP